MNTSRAVLLMFLAVLVISTASATVTLNYPLNNANLSLPSVTFNCSATSVIGLANITLYENWTGSWTANETKNISGTSNSSNFTKQLPEGKFVWNCQQADTSDTTSMSASNFTLNVDRTPPSVSSVFFNETYTCGISSLVRVNCTTTDSFTGIKNVTIVANSPTDSYDYPAQLLSGNTYYSDVSLNQTGFWNFTCVSYDYAGNSANSTSSAIETYYSTPDLTINRTGIKFSNLNPLENQQITINANVYNNGCQDSGNFWTAFYNGDPASSGIQVGTNKSMSIPQRSNQTVNITWTTTIGPTNFFVVADFNNSISEGNESNNKANKTIDVTSWQTFFGNVTASKLLGNSGMENMTLWFNDSKSTGMIFVADKESIIHWASLVALSRAINGSFMSNDFSDIDALFNMTNFNDSISKKFTTDGSTPKQTENLTIESVSVDNVPVIDSTNNSNFKTGILWDSADDTSGNGQFDQTDKEKVVFVTEINKGALGAYGRYDYEISIPVRLRNQDTADTSEVYFYYELS
jgi:hypothetical protein